MASKKEKPAIIKYGSYKTATGYVSYALVYSKTGTRILYESKNLEEKINHSLVIEDCKDWCRANGYFTDLVVSA